MNNVLKWCFCIYRDDEMENYASERLLWTCLRTDTRLVKILFSTRGCLSREAKIKVPIKAGTTLGAPIKHTKKSLLSKNIANNISFFCNSFYFLSWNSETKGKLKFQIRSGALWSSFKRKEKEKNRRGKTWLQPNLGDVVPVLQRGDGPLPRSELLMVSRRRRCGSLVHTLVTAHHTRTFLWTPSTE